MQKEQKKLEDEKEGLRINRREKKDNKRGGGGCGRVGRRRTMVKQGGSEEKIVDL